MYDLQKVAEKIKEADAMLIRASNGLSIAEGLHIFADNQSFQELFGDYRRKYGIRCMLHGMGARWPSEEEYWAFWSRLIHHYCGEYTESQVMKDLKAVVGDKPYFVVTSNGECHFEMCGFAPEKVYEVEGNWLTMQCARGCHDALYPNMDITEKIAAAEMNGKAPSDLVPRCPECGGPMQIAMADPHSRPWDAGQERLQEFLNQYHGKKLVVLELGIGPGNQWIKAPLMRLVNREPHAAYITVNLGEIFIADNIKGKSFGLDGYLEEILCGLREACGEGHFISSPRRASFYESRKACIHKAL